MAGWVVAPPASAQVSCVDPNDLCTGDPCVTAALTVQSPCVVDFGNRTLVIGGALTVPAGGTLAFTAGAIDVQGRIAAPGGAVALTADAGPVDLRTEIDVGAGSLTVTAAGDVEARTRLKAKGGSLTLEAGGTLTTRTAAVLEVAPGGAITLAGDAGVVVGGKIFAGDGASGTVQITSDAGSVMLQQEVKVSGDPPSSVAVAGVTGVVISEGIAAVGKLGAGGAVTLASTDGHVELYANVRTLGFTGGTLNVQAPNGRLLAVGGVSAKGKTDGGAVTMAAAEIVVSRKKIEVQGGAGNGGTIALEASTLLLLDGVALDAEGKVDGGTIELRGDAVSGDVVVDGKTLTAAGRAGNGGTVTVAAPAGSVDVVAKIEASTKGGTGGTIEVDGVAVTVGPKARLVAEGRTGGGGAIRLAQSGAGLSVVSGTFKASEGGVVEALAPAGSLSVQGKLRVGAAGCVGFSAGGTLDTTAAVADVAIGASCP